MFNIRPWTLFLTSVFVSIFGIISHLVVVAELTSTTSVKVFRKRTKLNFVLQHPFFSVISENGQVRDVCVQKGVDGKLAWLETKNIHREEAVKSRWSLSDLKRKVSEQAGRFPKFQLFGAQEESRLWASGLGSLWLTLSSLSSGLFLHLVSGLCDSGRARSLLWGRFKNICISFSTWKAFGEQNEQKISHPKKSCQPYFYSWILLIFKKHF